MLASDQWPTLFSFLVIASSNADVTITREIPIEPSAQARLPGDAANVLSVAGQVFAIKTGFGAHSPACEVVRVNADMLNVEVAVALADCGESCWIDLFDYGAYQCTDDCITITRPACSEEHASEALQGPIALHALARRGVFVLHASAAISPSGQLHAFTAASGTGKSTVARLAQDFGWRRVADDLLPLSIGADGGLMAHPHLAQPKLSRAEQYPESASPAVAVAALIRLARADEAQFRPMSRMGLVRLVLESTVAARVYSKRSLAQHLEFAVAVAAGIDAGRLRAGELVLADTPQDLPGAIKRGLDLLDVAH